VVSLSDDLHDWKGTADLVPFTGTSSLLASTSITLTNHVTGHRSPGVRPSNAPGQWAMGLYHCTRPCMMPRSSRASRASAPHPVRANNVSNQKVSNCSLKGGDGVQSISATSSLALAHG